MRNYRLSFHNEDTGKTIAFFEFKERDDTSAIDLSLRHTSIASAELYRDGASIASFRGSSKPSVKLRLV